MVERAFQNVHVIKAVSTHVFLPKQCFPTENAMIEHKGGDAKQREYRSFLVPHRSVTASLY